MWGKIDDIGGAYYLAKVTNTVVSAAHIVKHSRIIMEKYLLREIIRIAGGLMAQGFQDAADPFEILEEAERDIFAVRAGSIKKEFRTLDRILVEILQELEELRHRDKHLTGVPAGYKDLDYVTCGWQPGDLVILAARPSVGKTAFALALAHNAVRLDPDGAVGFFSLEMKDKKLVHRLLSSESGTWIWNLSNARMDDAQMKTLYDGGIQPLAKVKVLIDDTTSLPVTEFRAKARRMVAKHGVKIIFVDYLQLMSAPEYINNREQQIAYMSRELKATAKELNIPVIALAQMSRDVEKQKTREPQLSDLRESGAIEQDADIVIFLWKPMEADLIDRPELLNACYVGIKKHRNGALAKFVGIFQKEIQRWATVALIDDVTLRPIGDKWLASTKPPNLIDFTEAKRSGDELSGPPDPENKKDLPF
jgi:replicative DNA helicase